VTKFLLVTSLYIIQASGIGWMDFIKKKAP
jgi:hypothetical protein